MCMNKPYLFSHSLTYLLTYLLTYIIYSVQENFDLLISFIQELADKHIPSKTSRSVSSIPWVVS